MFNLAKYNNPEYIGQKFWRMTVEEIIHKNSQYFWKCKCDCGETRIVNPGKLISGMIKSCGCKKRESPKNSKSKEYRNEYMRELRKWRKEHHVCLFCGEKDAYTMNGNRLCGNCSDKNNSRKRRTLEKKETEPPIPREEWVSYGLCYTCGKNKVKEGIRPYANVPYHVCEECYQKLLKAKQAYKDKYGGYGIRYIQPPTYKTKNAIDTYRKLLNDQKERKRMYQEETGNGT